MKENKKNVITIIVAVTLLLVFVIGLTYALFSFTGKGQRINQISTTSVTMSYSEAQNGITLTNAMPMSDSVGVELTGDNNTFYFTVSISTGNNQTLAYEISAEKLTGSSLGNNDVKLYLEKSDDGTNYSAVRDPKVFTPESSATPIGTKSGEMVLDMGSSTTSKNIYYLLRMWVSDTYVVDENERTFSVKINVYGTDTVVLPNSISLNKNSAEIVVGDTEKLEATVTPSGASYSDVIWSSSDENIATVSSSGVVTGVSEGNAIITARTKSGLDTNCSVIVNSAPTSLMISNVDLYNNVSGVGTKSYSEQYGITATAGSNFTYNFNSFKISDHCEIGTTITMLSSVNADKGRITVSFLYDNDVQFSFEGVDGWAGNCVNYSFYDLSNSISSGYIRDGQITKNLKVVYNNGQVSFYVGGTSFGSMNLRLNNLNGILISYQSFEGSYQNAYVKDVYISNL